MPRRLNPFEKPLFVPQVDDPLVIQLPGERVRGVVRGVPDDDTAIVELVVATLNNKTHRYKKGDYVPCRRRSTTLEEIWEAVDERQLEMAAALRRLAEQEKHEAAVAEAERKEKEIADAARKRKQARGHKAERPGNAEGRPSKESKLGSGVLKRSTAPAR